jgi:manganese oxidase
MVKGDNPMRSSGSIKMKPFFTHLAAIVLFGGLLSACSGAPFAQTQAPQPASENPAVPAGNAIPVSGPETAAESQHSMQAATATPFNPSTQPAAQTGKTREYFIGAVEVEWDYAPSGKNLITGEAFGDQENVFVENGDDRIGHVYTKAVFREFSDNSFSSQKPIPAEWQHLGILGPSIHAEVGDKILIHFKNFTQIPTSMHPHGVFYTKSSEGAPYSDGTDGADKEDDAVPPGGEHLYQWDVPDRAGPGPMEGSSVMWMYHSHVDEVGDTNAGLMGPIIITAQGKAKPDGSPIDVDREFVVMFSVMDENVSPYLQHNIDTKTGTPSSVDPDDEEFGESNLMHSMNGYVYGNLPGLEMKQGERVRWYLMGMGTEVDLHTPHWHGNTVVSMGMRMDVVSLLPASMITADMTPDNPGTWLFHCHVNDHIIAGMMATYKVLPE